MQPKNIMAVKQILQQLNIPLCENEPMAKHTSFKIGGPAALFCTPTNEQQVMQSLQAAAQHNLPYLMLGKGSNLLFCDGGYQGLIIHITKALADVTVQNNTITAAAGAELANVCKTAVHHNLAGLEFAYGIPGSVGGAVYMNAGAYGSEMRDVLRSVRYINEQLQIVELAAEQLKLSYRHSIFHEKPWYILSATFELKPGNAQDIKTEMDGYMQQRLSKQPLNLPSAGSAFKRPEGAFAGALIDQCGLRGYRIGDAAVSEKHCGFIVNLGAATCEQVLQLAEHVTQTVKQNTGYNLEKEICVVSSDGKKG